MSDIHEELLAALAKGERGKAERLIRSGLDLNAPCDQGAPALFPAILTGDVSLIRLMLESGADPNFVADEPAATIYASKPLELAMQARFLMSQEKYHPVVKLLEEFGASEA